MDGGLRERPDLGVLGRALGGAIAEWGQSQSGVNRRVGSIRSVSALRTPWGRRRSSSSPLRLCPVSSVLRQCGSAGRQAAFVTAGTSPLSQEYSQCTQSESKSTPTLDSLTSPGICRRPPCGGSCSERRPRSCAPAAKSQSGGQSQSGVNRRVQCEAPAQPARTAQAGRAQLYVRTTNTNHAPSWPWCAWPPTPAGRRGSGPAAPRSRARPRRARPSAPASGPRTPPPGRSSGAGGP
jgi:hypothetical protein